MRKIPSAKDWIIGSLLLLFLGYPVSAESFDKSLCYQIISLRPDTKIELSSSKIEGVLGSNGETVAGYILEGRLASVWDVKKGLIHLGRTKDRATNETGAFVFGTDITDITGSVSLRAKAGPKGAVLCMCDATTPEARENVKALRKAASAKPVDQGALAKFEAYSNKRRTCNSAARKSEILFQKSAFETIKNLKETIKAITELLEELESEQDE